MHALGESVRTLCLLRTKGCHYTSIFWDESGVTIRIGSDGDADGFVVIVDVSRGVVHVQGEEGDGVSLQDSNVLELAIEHGRPKLSVGSMLVAETWSDLASVYPRD